MASPFPGMDPYLEGSAWESFHAAFIGELGRLLAPKVRPKYLVRVERRFVSDARAVSDGLSVGARDVYPDVSVLSRATPAEAPIGGGGSVVTLEAPVQLETILTARVPQRSIAIIDVGQRTLVAAIELLSPSNKRTGGGREEYIERRENFLGSDAHLVELDLLRRGTRLPMRGTLPAAPYYAFVSRADRRPLTGAWPIELREPLPTIPVPLLPDDGDVALDLQAALCNTYDAFGFDLELDYARPPQVALAPDDAAWAAQRVSEARRNGTA